MREYTSSQSSHRGSDESVPPQMGTDPRLLLLSIVHDFNNLLTPVVTILEELQRRRAGTSREITKIDGAIYCAFRAKALARQLLDLANPRQARPEPTDTGQLLELLEAVLASVLSPNIRLVLDVVDNLPPAFIDREFLERALLNLVLNARDAMPGGGHVTVAAAMEFLPSNKAGLPERMIRLSVSDNGIGMDDRTLKMAGQSDFSTKTNRNGLDLATVRQIAESLGGRFSITSTPRQGSTIDLWLPAMSACSGN